jgi:uncharacterized protein YbaP (TraB family)
LKKSFLFLILLSVCSFSQEKKYQSLFWEISGNGLTKNSYLYGTMHVSDKVSYHLSDAFFTKLLASDFVANESEPNTWMEVYDLMNGINDYGNYPNFYSGFNIEPLEKKALYPLFATKGYNLINLLSRTNDYSQDYQEETYLDMFIYRTGKKYGKKTLGLEDVKATTIAITKAQSDMDYKEIENNKQALLKVLKKRNYNEVLTDAYREKDLDLIDTINKLASPKKYMKAMLLDRNEIMAKSMDSIMKTGSLFSAVGAAHLPGNMGIVEILRRKGYTVKPIFDKYSEKGKKTKKTIEDLFVKPTFVTKSTPDEMVTLPLFPLTYYLEENIESADLTNGGSISVKRMSKLDFLGKKDKEFKHETLDSLFFENIPGEILDKQSYKEKENYVYDIKSITKTGKNQRFRYYITPLEIIGIIMSGEGDYVRKYEDEVFKNIKIKSYKSGFENFSSNDETINFKTPAYYKYSGNNKDKKSTEDLNLLGFEDNAHYFVIEKSLLDVNNLEDTEFELKRMHYEFYLKQKLDSTNTKFDKNKFEFTSSSKIENKEINLKSVVKANKYYLLGTVNASKTKTETFFNSLQVKKYKKEVKYRVYKDTSAYFSVEIPKKENEYLDFKFEPNYGYQDNKNKNHFEPKSKSVNIYSPKLSKIELNYYGPHKYESQKAVDSLFANFRKNLAKDFETEEYAENYSNADVAIDSTAAVDASFVKELLNDDSDKFSPLNYTTSNWNKNLGLDTKQKLELTNEKITQDTKQDYYTFEVLATKPKSIQAIKIKAILKHGELFMLKTLVDKDYKNDDEFIEKAYNSLKVENAKSKTFFENKFDYFVEDLNSEHDSIKSSAIKSFYELDITETDLPKIKNLINTRTFAVDEQEVLSNLYEKLGNLKSPEVSPFLVEAYKKPQVTTEIQFSILQALTSQKSELAYEKIAELLEYDLPISDDAYQVESLFNLFSNDTKNSKVLYPNILEFYSIKEYHSPIVSFVKDLVADKQINVKKLKSYNKMLLTNAKLEFKRLQSWKNKSDSQKDNEEEYGYYNEVSPYEDLNNYLTLLTPFKKDSKIEELISKSKALNISDFNVAFAERELLENGKISTEMIETLTKDKKTKYNAYQMMFHNNQQEQLNLITKDSIVKAAIDFYEDFDAKKMTLAQLEPKTITHNNKKITYYFYKKVNIEEQSYTKNEVFLTGIAFVEENDKLNLKAFKKLESKKIVEESEIEENIKTLIDKSLNEKHLRANFNGSNNEFYGTEAVYDEY